MKTEFTTPDTGAAKTARDKLMSIDVRSLQLDQLKELLAPIFIGYRIEAPIFDPGLPLFSAHVGKKLKTLTGVKNALFRRAKSSYSTGSDFQVLHCSPGRDVAILNARPTAGDTVCVVHWRTKSKMATTHVGYTAENFASLGSDREVVGFGTKPVRSLGKEHDQLVQLISELFFRSSPASDFGDDPLTTAIAEHFLSAEPINAIIYPSARTRGNSDVLAVKARFAEEHFEFTQAEFVQIEEVDGDTVKFKILDTAPELGPRGKIEWYAASTVGQPAKRYGTVGWEEFMRQKKNILSAYDSAKDLSKNRPVQTEHGNSGEASFREWLSAFLPKKYGVTSGFVIPDMRKMNYKLRHHDVIVYDSLESPVLWATANPDISPQGRARAIPAEHIRAVFEVKASFNKSSIGEGKEKLAELNAYRAHLPQCFVSCMVFFEIREDQQKPSDLGGELLVDDVVGYFGGLILRAEGLDPNISGYFTLSNNFETELDESMPLVREVSQIARNLDGTYLTLSHKGDFASAISIDDIWNFDVGYAPIIPGIHLAWAYNSFPHFCLDLLERLEGRYDSKGPQRSLYGMSFIR